MARVPYGPKYYSLEEIERRPERGRRLTVARLAADFTISQAAQAVGVSTSLVCMYEHGTAHPSERQVQRFIDAYERVAG